MASRQPAAPCARSSVHSLRLAKRLPAHPTRRCDLPLARRGNPLASSHVVGERGRSSIALRLRRCPMANTVCSVLALLVTTTVASAQAQAPALQAADDGQAARIVRVHHESDAAAAQPAQI